MEFAVEFDCCIHDLSAGGILPYCLGDETRIIADRWIIVQIRDSQLERRSCRSINRRRRVLDVGLERYIPWLQMDVFDDEWGTFIR